MRPQQLDDAHRSALAQLVDAACERAAVNLSRFTGARVGIDVSEFQVTGLRASVIRLESMRPRTTVISERVTGDVEGIVVLVLPPGVALRLAEMLGVPPGDEEMTQSALGELGNIVIGGFVNELADRAGLEIDPSLPVVNTGSTALLNLAIAEAGSDHDAVVSFAAPMHVQGTALAMDRLDMLFIPSPGGLHRVIDRLRVASRDDAREVSVNMGELAVVSRGDSVLVARGLGSCIGLAIVDPVAGVGALAHVMLPQAPERMTLGGRPTYPARYADTAVRSALSAIERAGGSRLRARAYLVGGSQMFEELAEFDRLRISQRNIDAVLEALMDARVVVEGSDVGGSAGRVMELRLDPLAITCRVPSEGRTVDLLHDAAA